MGVVFIRQLCSLSILQDEEEESKKTCEGSPPSSPSSAGDSHDKKRCRMLRSVQWLYHNW